MVGTTTREYLKEHPEHLTEKEQAKQNLELTQRELLVKILDTLESLKKIAEEEADKTDSLKRIAQTEADYKRNMRQDTSGSDDRQEKYYH
jgi:hypothetical protein